MAAYSIFQLFSLLCVALFFIGLLNVYFTDSVNNCEMTYMFEYPQFVRIRVQGNDLYPQYGLYSYSEGRLTERARKMRFDGIPVLFLPGSSGSHMQVRSLASVALRKALSYEYDVHFDYFTVSYNEELSGLYGGVLEKQLEFATMCQSSILNLYRANSYMQTIPTSIIVIGHSMGGLIAAALLTHPTTQNSTSIVITMSAPLQAPVINFDEKINDFYLTVKQGNNDPIMQQKVLISLGGGPRDVMVPSALAGSESSDLTALTTAIPGVWVTTDHLSIVWCKQLVIAVNKFLFSLVDFKSNQLDVNKASVLEKARRFFQANRSEIFDPGLPRQIVSMNPDGFWFEDSRRVYQLQKTEITRTTYVMMRLVSFTQNRFAVIEAVNVDDRDWIFGCNAAFVNGHMRYCKTAESLSDLSRWSASADTNRRKMATVPMHEIMDTRPDWTHVVVKISPTRKPITLNIDINDRASRTISVELPYMTSFFKKTLIEETELGSLYYELKLIDLTMLYQSYLLYLEPTEKCKSLNYHTTAELRVPWAQNFEYVHHFTPQMKSPMRLYLNKGNMNRSDESAASITLLLDPQCTYSISISPSFYGSLGQYVRYYSPQILPYIAAILILVLRENMMSVKETGYCGGMLAALASENLKPYYVLVMAKLAWIVFRSVPIFTYILETSFLMDGIFLTDQGGALLPVLLYLCALGIVIIATAVTLATMLFSSQLVHRLVWRFVWSGGAIFGESLSSILSRAPVLCSVALLLIAQSTSAPAALAAGAAVYAILVSKMYEEYLEELGYKLVAKFIWRFLSRFKFSKHDFKTDERQAEESTTCENQAVKDSEKKALLAGESSEDSMAVTDSLAIEQDGEENKCEKYEDGGGKEDNSSDQISKETTATEEATGSENLRSELVKAEAISSDAGVNSDEPGVREDVFIENVIDVELSNINFHTSVFFLWLIVALVNSPALVTWARNFRYSVVLRPDTSYSAGVLMSACAGFLWQMDGLRPNLKHYELLSSILFGLAVITTVMGPIALYYINYTISIAVLLITLQQLFDKEIIEDQSKLKDNNLKITDKSCTLRDHEGFGDDGRQNDSRHSDSYDSPQDGGRRPRQNSSVANPDVIYERFRNVKDKHEFANLDLNATESFC